MDGAVHPDFWWGLGIATAIAILATLRLKYFRADEYPQMNWMDWCGYYALIGVFTILVSAITTWKALAIAGVLLLFPLYPLALLGLAGRLDDMRISAARAWRRR